MLTLNRVGACQFAFNRFDLATLSDVISFDIKQVQEFQKIWQPITYPFMPTVSAAGCRLAFALGR